MKDEVKEVKKDNKEARISYLERTVEKMQENWKVFVKQHVDEGCKGKIGSAGIKQLVVICAISLVAMFAFSSDVDVDNKSQGTGTYTLTQDDSATGDITLTVDEVVANVTGNVTGESVSTGLDTKTPTSANVTNAQAYTIVADYTILNGIGGANDTTNTITIANAGVIGYTVTIVVNGASSNLIGLADSGNLKLSAAFQMDNYDSLTLYSQGTNVWVETSRSDN